MKSHNKKLKRQDISGQTHRPAPQTHTYARGDLAPGLCPDLDLDLFRDCRLCLCPRSWSFSCRGLCLCPSLGRGRGRGLYLDFDHGDRPIRL